MLSIRTRSVRPSMLTSNVSPSTRCVTTACSTDGVSVVMLGAMAVVGNRIGGETVVGVAAPAAPASTVRTTPPPPQLMVPNVQGMTGEEAVAALTAAGFRNIIFALNGAPRSAKVLTQDPVPGRT